MRLRIPPVIQVIFFSSAMLVISRYAVKASFGFTDINEFALICLTGVVVMIGSGIVAFRKAKTTVTTLHPDKTSIVVTMGIYQYKKNPMYFGLLLILFSFEIYLQNLASMFVLPVYVWFISKNQIMSEEEALKKIFMKNIKTTWAGSGAGYSHASFVYHI